MLITINTDASFYNEYKLGSYALWITADIGRLRKVGVFKDSVNSSHEAEFKAIINALYILVKNEITPITRVIINTDSLTTINLINAEPQKQAKSKWGKELIQTYKKFIKKHGLKDKIEFRHVVSHLHKNTARNWVNDWLDKEAKKILRKKIAELKNNPIFTSSN